MNGVLGPQALPARRALTGERGVALPPFVDHHVHLHLIDEAALHSGGIAAVLDLGGDPAALAGRTRDAMPHTAYAGAFLTAPGGYPSGRAWAPPGAVREVGDPSPHPGVAGGAATAVDEQADSGASVIKVALNAAAGPVPDSRVLDAVVTRAHERGLPVVAHVEGEGMLARALDAGIDALAHAPFSDWASGAEIARAVTMGQRWISTLSIHGGIDRERAFINLETFARAGGHVLYGTDLGNGERPAGLDRRELTLLGECGIRGADLVAALAEPWLPALRAPGVATFVPGDPPADPDDLAGWLTAARVVPTEELIHDDH